MRSSLRIYRKTLFRSSEKKVAKVPKISSFHLLYPNKPLSLRCSHADRTGGNRHILKRRLLASCLLHLKLRNFETRGDRAAVDVCVGCIVSFRGFFMNVRKFVTYISAWASTLLILLWRQCEGLRCGISDRRIPRFFCICWFIKDYLLTI